MRVICSSSELQDGGKGWRFTVLLHGQEAPAFAIRFRGVVYAYLNRCAHVPTELDWNPGEFFDGDGRYLICGTHGALYWPESGRCAGGRCQGKGLLGLAVEERDGQVYLVET